MRGSCARNPAVCWLSSIGRGRLSRVSLGVRLLLARRLLAGGLHREGETKRIERRFHGFGGFRGLTATRRFLRNGSVNGSEPYSHAPTRDDLGCCVVGPWRVGGDERMDSYELLAGCRAVPRRSAESAKSAFHLVNASRPNS